MGKNGNKFEKKHKKSVQNQEEKLPNHYEEIKSEKTQKNLYGI
jgi:hypothetical protein